MSSTDETHKVYSMELDDLSWRYNGIQQMIETRSARLMQIDSELADIQRRIASANLSNGATTGVPPERTRNVPRIRLTSPA